MPANINTFVMREGTENPWWGVGQTISANASIEDWIKITKLDYRVVRKNIWMEENQSKLKIDGFVAIVRSTDGTIFQIASNKYRPIQNADMLALMKYYCETHEMTLETMGSLGEDGAIVWGLAKINFEFELPGNDKVVAYLLLASSHDGSIQWTGQITFVRVVCQNTLTIALADKKGKNVFRKKHTKNLNVTKVTDDAKKEIELLKKSAKQAQMEIELLASTKLPKFDAEKLTAKLTNNTELLDKILEVERDANARLLDQIIAKSNRGSFVTNAIADEQSRTGKAILDAMLNSPGSEMESSKETVWGWINGVSYYTDHESGSDKNRMKSAWFGPNADLKDRAMNLAMEYVNEVRAN